MKKSEGYQEESVKFVPDDVIAGILGFIEPIQKTAYLKGDPRIIHETIFRLREKYPLLQDLAFSKEDVYPFSHQLERILSRLQVARILGMESPDFKRYVVRGKAKKIIHERIHTRFNIDQIFELKNIAKEFSESCLAPSQEE